ncbi:MAG TPA: CoA transferase [Candidatus Methylomirabilis sp.]|nr:CoA transferase [Candidatus Methylomirabilis sp.]
MANGPLTGVRILDFTSYLAGPYGCALLADLGADVLKIEAPDGDMLRRYPSTLPGESRAFLGINRNKRGLVVDLKHPDGRAVVHRLVRDADVLVENFRPAVPPRLGIDYETLARINPKLIYCAVTGYGDRGPLRDQPGFDQVLQSMTGIAAAQGAPEGRPQLVLGSAVDYYAAAMAAMGIVAALFHRAESGRGQYLGVSLLRSALTMQAARFVWVDGEPREVERDLAPGRVAGIHPTRDGYLYFSAATERFWQNLCEVLGLDDLAADPRYDTMRKRAERADELLPRLHQALGRHTAEEWEALMKERVPCAVVHRIEDMFDHPQVLAEEIVTSVSHPTVGDYRTMTRAVVFGETEEPSTRAAPTLGQHTDEVLAERGFSSEEIASLRVRGVIA